jgi:SHS2 domain-containing protein
MTDAVIEAYGPTLENAFENAAVALNDTMVDVKSITAKETIALSANGSDLKELLFEWLDKVMLTLLIDRFVMCSFNVIIHQEYDQYHIEASAAGEPLDLQKHRYKVEIKAVTYHEMSIDQKDGETVVRFILDL